jgi:D-psicose/D-tagatose/L-ribulose 3-epimerase
MFKYGVHTFIWTEYFTEKDLPLIGKAKSLGFEVVDIGILNPAALENFPTKGVKEKVKETGIEVVILSPMSRDANLIDPDPDIRKNAVEFLKKLVDVSVEVDSKIVAGEICEAVGYLTGKPRTTDEWNWSVEGMREVGLYAKETSDVDLAVEVVNRFETHFLNTAEDAVKYCKDVGTGNIKVHLDSYHMIREETNFREAVEVCGKEFLGYVHVCENNRGVPGTGLVPWEEFFRALKDIDYQGALTIEAFDPKFKELNKVTATWRYYTDTGEELAMQGLRNLKEIEKRIH